jgi:hypothetical protein
MSADRRPWWSAIAVLIAFLVFAEAVFAGAMFSASGWALPAHSVTAGVLLAVTLGASIVALLTLRRVPRGRKLAWELLALTVMITLQAAMGALSAKGMHLLWIHVPLGVALFGLATQAAIAAITLDAKRDESSIV